jgi:ribosome-associated translation inhibitor RaiA
MRHTQESHHLRALIDAHHCEPSAAQIERLLGDLESLGRQVEHFPVSDLHILIERNTRSNDYAVKTTLVLPGRTLVAGDRDASLHAAYKRCLDVLSGQVVAYKDRLGQVPQRHRLVNGTQQELRPVAEADAAALDAAAAAHDYAAFRAALAPYDEPLRLRAGRWAQRYPDLDGAIGRGLEVADLVEKVFLSAFDAYAQRPRDVRLGDWLEALLGPAADALRRGGAALEAVRLARSAVEAERNGQP